MRQELVATEAEILMNVVTFIDGVRQPGPDQSDFIEMVKLGREFYPYSDGKGIAFAPSRFVGYRNNNLENHRLLKSNKIANGGPTTRAITKALRTAKPEADPYLEKCLAEYKVRVGAKISRKEQHKFWHVPLVDRAIVQLDSAMDDINLSNDRNDDPRYRELMSRAYRRDSKVRDQVLQRASGRCEYGACVPFISRSGRPYLEAHHVVSLAADGDDAISNVIALCANHHRESHSGENWEALNAEFLTILERLGCR
jgi:HNH endonuclease